MRRTCVLTVAVLLATVFVAPAQTVFVVRHAERADAGMAGSLTGSDPELSDAGKERAQSLAAALKDGGITAIFVTEFKRTQHTAEPLARVLGIQPTLVSSKDLTGLIAKVKAACGNTLVVGHSNTVPETLKQLGAAEAVKLGAADYDNLFVVTRGEKPALLRLHFR